MLCENTKSNLRKIEEICFDKMHGAHGDLGPYLQEFLGLKFGTEAGEQLLNFQTRKG